MLKNYLLIALRVLKNNTLFSGINILGLSIGLAASIIIYLWVYDELSYDRFHENADRIYRVERDMTLDGDRMVVPITSPPAGPQIVADYPEVEAFVRLASENVMVEDADRNRYNERIFYADSSFFDVFSFSLTEGSVDDCLKEPFTIAISSSYARKYFGEDPEPGSVLNVSYSGQISPYTVTAIFEDFPHNSHIQADIIGSFASLYTLKHEMMMKSWMASHHYTYILLKENTNAAMLETNLQEMVDKYFWPEFRNFLEVDNPREFLKLKLMPLEDIHLESNRVWEIESPGSKTSVLVFSLVSVLLLIIAGINFMNLSTARASKRALEVGIRKVSGATKAQLIRQFLGESILFSFLALVLAFIFIELTLPWFSLFTGKSISATLILKDWNLPVIISAWIATAFFAGVYPAFFLSAYKPVEVLKGKKGAKGSHFFRRALVVGQFAVSIGLIICAVSVFRQLQYINNKDLGYNRHGLIDILVENRYNFNSYQVIKDDLLSIPEVKNVTRSVVIPTDRSYTDNPYLMRDNPETFFPVINSADENYIPTFEIGLLAGSNFTNAMTSDYESVLYHMSPDSSDPDPSPDAEDTYSMYYIINDAARRMFGFETPSDAVGEFIGLLAGQDGETSDWGEIVGVVEDFHYQPLTEEIKPMVISSSLRGHNHITLRVDEADMAETNQLISEVWNDHFPGQVYASIFVSQKFDALHLTERRLQVILLIFTVLSVFIACLGLLGLSAFSVEQRIKEIGIRKAIGAEIHQIIILISSEFSRLVIISCLIAIPLAYFILREWLNNFPYRRDIEVWVFLAASLAGWITAMLTVFLQTYRAGRVNPVETLKYE